jgi:hypothetical protein
LAYDDGSVMVIDLLANVTVRMRPSRTALTTKPGAMSAPLLSSAKRRFEPEKQPFSHHCNE